jgi:hypothetical protein
MGRIYEVRHSDGMGSGAMIYIPSFIKFGSAIRKLIERAHRQTNSMVMA